MPISMQGPWTVSVKSVEAGTPPQQFIISGAASGNGTYNTAHAPVSVTGDSWAISIQSNPGTGFVTSFDQITFPVRSGGNYTFDIQSGTDDVDPIFDDCVLTCSTPITLGDYLLYGSVSHYSDLCIFNPCSLPNLAIETSAALAQALLNPALRVPIAQLYPDRVRPPVPVPGPDPGPFQKIVIPLREQTALPTQVAQVFRLGTDAAPKAKAPAAPPAVRSTQTMSLRQANQTAVAFDRAAVSGIVDHLVNRCQTGPLTGVLLRFQQYDRTNAELAGGPYTGTGPRENLGTAASDRRGNYIFRFQRTLAQYIEELNVDVAPGEDVWTAILPDIIVQLLDPRFPAGFCYESAPYWNVPFLKQINICVPDNCVGRLPGSCQGANAIQAIGRILIGDPPSPPIAGQPPGYGQRTRPGLNTFLGAEGRITVTDGQPNVPQARCAAWFSSLDFFACFMDHPEVKHYSIQWRLHGAAGWNFFTEPLSHYYWPTLSYQPVGPLLGVSAQVNGGALALAPVYLNIENDNNWLAQFRDDLKATITSSLYAPAGSPGPIDFRIQGYNGAGALVAATDDTVTLYIDNNGIDLDIASVEMINPDMTVNTGGDCALFNLEGQPATPLIVRFKANQLEAFMNAYGLSMRKGNIPGTFSLVAPLAGQPQLNGQYTHGDNLVCNTFEGTFDDPTHDGSGYVTVNLSPASGHWLDVGQQFCTFVINLDASMRETNGYNNAVYSYGPRQYLLGMQAS